MMNFIIDDIDELFHEDNGEEVAKEIDYCNWVYDKSKYSPAVEVEIVKKIERGIYRINNDFTLSKQSISSDGIYKLPDSEINHILDEVNKFLDKSKKFKEHHLMHKRGILLEGPPGTGKTSIITLLIQELVNNYDAIVLLINSVKDFSLAYEFLKSTFRKIEPKRFVVTIIEDIDKVCNDVIEPEILDFLDGKASIDHHLIITTSNNTTDLPDALLRPSRIDRRFYIGYPSETSRREFFKNKGVEESQLDTYVKKSEDLTLSELKELYIGTYILDNDFDEVIDQILNPFEKKEYVSKKSSNPSIEVD